MCMEHKVICSCSKNTASFNFKNELLPPEVIHSLYCPECSKEVEIEQDMMIDDNGWIIHYDMEIAEFYSQKLPADDRDSLSPEVIFDSGYATWRGIYPGDHIDSVNERNELSKLAKSDPKEYFNTMKTWALDRMARLKNEGWRKAYDE